MPSPRRVGAMTSKTRALLLDVTKQLILDEGYAAVTSRRVGDKAGVRAGLIHYYFPTLDDLFVAVARRETERHLERLAAALQTDDPLHVVWEHAGAEAETGLLIEFMALANHRKAIRTEIAGLVERIGALQLEALSARWKDYGFDQRELPPGIVLTILTSIPRMILMEEAIGVSAGHAETMAFIERRLGTITPAPAAESSAKAPAKKKATARKKATAKRSR